LRRIWILTVRNDSSVNEYVHYMQAIDAIILAGGQVYDSRTPHRISFFGGGADSPAWYLEYDGKVLAYEMGWSPIYEIAISRQYTLILEK